MINRKNTALSLLALGVSVLALSGCSMFNQKAPEDRLEGKRISVLELQKSLTPDQSLMGGENIVLAQQWANPSWPQAGGYPSHVLHHLALNDATLNQVWKADIGRGKTSKFPLNAQPIVVENTVFTLDTASNVTAFNAQNGERLWRVDVENEDEGEAVISGGIAFAQNTLYVTNGYDEILALSPENGDIKWRTRLPAPSRAAPTIQNGRVFVTTIDSRLVALDAASGNSLWEYSGINETTGLVGAASAGANNDIVVPVFSSGEITALRVENGSVAWSDNLASVNRTGGGLVSLSDIKAMPVVDRGMIIAISFSGKIAAIDERTGTRIWQKEISGTQTPWVSGNVVYVISSENQLIGLNIRDGGIFWVEQLPEFVDPVKNRTPIQWFGPIMAGGHLISVSSNGTIREMSPKSGLLITQFETKKDIHMPPIVANNTLYLLSDDGTLLAYQ